MSKLLEDIASVKPRSDTRREREMYFVLYTHRTVADVVVKPLVCMLLMEVVLQRVLHLWMLVMPLLMLTTLVR